MKNIDVIEKQKSPHKSSGLIIKKPSIGLKMKFEKKKINFDSKKEDDNLDLKDILGSGDI